MIQGTQGYSAAATSDVYARARVLAGRAGGSVSLAILQGLRNSAVTRGELRTSLSLADQMLAVARQIGSPKALSIAHNQQGIDRYYLGDLLGARHHFRCSLQHYREQDFIGGPGLFDPGIGSLSWASANEWFLGYPDRGLHSNHEALLLAHRLNHPFPLAQASAFGTHVYSYRGDFERALHLSEQAMKLGTDSGFPIWNIMGKIRAAWARAQMGEGNDSEERMRQALKESDGIRFYLARPLFLILLSETQVLARDISGALASVEQALEANSEAKLYHPIALRLRGELRLLDADSRAAALDASERDFRDSVSISQEMSAKSLELRASTSLARLLMDTGRRDQARAQLAEVYNWFTEGFDTADLKEAKTLLDELGN